MLIQNHRQNYNFVYSSFYVFRQQTSANFENKPKVTNRLILQDAKRQGVVQVGRKATQTKSVKVMSKCPLFSYVSARASFATLQQGHSHNTNSTNSNYKDIIIQLNYLFIKCLLIRPKANCKTSRSSDTNKTNTYKQATTKQSNNYNHNTILQAVMFQKNLIIQFRQANFRITA
jgi:hypothetical protein